MKPLSKRTESFTDSVIRRMARVSLQYGAVNLSQGFPDFDPPRQLTDALAGPRTAGRTSTPSPGAHKTSARPSRASRAASWA